MSVDVRDERVQIVLPDDIDLPLGGLNAQWPTRHWSRRRCCISTGFTPRAFALSNNLNQVMLDSENPRLGIVTSGKTYLDVMDAHIEGKGCSTLNQTGLAQKFGAVVSHVRVAQHQQQINAVRISEGDADLLLGCDLVVSAMPEAIARLNIERSHSIVNNCQNPTADFIHDKNYTFPAREMQQLIGDETGADKASFAGIPD